MRKLLITLTLIISAVLTGSAQQEPTVERKLVYASRPFFVPHWYVKAQAGAAYDIGEAKFSQLISPSLVKTGKMVRMELMDKTEKTAQTDLTTFLWES